MRFLPLPHEILWFFPIITKKRLIKLNFQYNFSDISIYFSKKKSLEIYCQWKIHCFRGETHLANLNLANFPKNASFKKSGSLGLIPCSDEPESNIVCSPFSLFARLRRTVPKRAEWGRWSDVVSGRSNCVWILVTFT